MTLKKINDEGEGSRRGGRGRKKKEAERKLACGKPRVCKRYWHNKAAAAEAADCLQYIMSLLLLMGPDF